MSRTKLFSRRVAIAGVVALIWLVPAVAPAVEIEAVCFTPGGACTEVIVDQIAAARRQVLVQAYSFTSPEIVKALVAARKRGVEVGVILDKSNVCRDDGACDKKGAIAADTLGLAKVAVLIDRTHAIAHNKVMVIDRERVITGSFNFTRAAQQRNAENLLVIRDPRLAGAYAGNWDVHARHAEPYR